MFCWSLPRRDRDLASDAPKEHQAPNAKAVQRDQDDDKRQIVSPGQTGHASIALLESLVHENNQKIVGLEHEKRSLADDVWTLRHECKRMNDDLEKESKDNERLSVLLEAKQLAMQQIQPKAKALSKDHGQQTSVSAENEIALNNAADLKDAHVAFKAAWSLQQTAVKDCNTQALVSLIKNNNQQIVSLQHDKEKLVAGLSGLRHDYQRIMQTLIEHLKECDNQKRKKVQVQQLFSAIATTNGKLKALETKYREIEQANSLKNAMPSKKFLRGLKKQLFEYENNAKALHILKQQHKECKKSSKTM